MVICPHPVSSERGVSRSSRTLEAGSGGREDAQRGLPRRRKHCLRTSEIVRSRRPDAGVNPRGQEPGGTEANKPGTPGRPRISRKPSRRGCRRVFGCTCGRLVCVLCAFAAREARGCNGTRHSLRPLDFREWRKRCTTRANHAAGTRRRALHVIASAAKQSRPHPRMQYGLLRRFAPRNDGAAA